MTSKLNRQPQNVPAVDPRTGQFTTPWYRVINDLMVRTGGDTARTNVELGSAVDQAHALASIAAATHSSRQQPAVDWQTLAIGQALAAHQPNKPAVDWQTALAAGLLRRDQIQQAQQALSLTQQFVSVSADTSIPNARVLTAGSNVTLDTSTPGQIKVNATGGSSSNITPDTHPATPTAWDDEFEYGSIIDTTGSRRAGSNPWSWLNQSTAFANVSQGSLVLNGSQQSVNQNNLVVQPATAGATYVCKLVADGSTGSNYRWGGMVAYCTESGNFTTLIRSEGSSTRTLELNTWTNFSSLAGNISYQSIFNGLPYTRSSRQPMYLKMQFVSANSIQAYFSDCGLDGTWVSVGSYVSTGGNLDKVGLVVGSSNNLSSNYAAFDWFRRVS